MAEVTAREANQQFARILKLATEQGEQVIITKHGKPVAKLVPLKAESAEETSQRERRRTEALEFFRKGLTGGTVVDWTRDELYSDECERPWEPRE